MSRRPDTTPRRWLRRTVSALVAVPTAAVMVAVFVLTLWTQGVSVPGASGATWFSIQKTGEAHYTPTPEKPTFLLVVGSDARPGEDGGRGDAIHLIGVNGEAGKATVLNIPRDTYVPIPGYGTEKINNAYAYGGGRLMADTVSQLVGVDIPYVISTDFAGLTAMVDEMGGIDVDVPVPHNDSASGAVFDQGVNHLSGPEALAFSRNRKGFTDGDFSRTQNQGLLIISALAQLQADDAGAVETIEHLAILGRHTKLSGVGLGELYNLGRLGLSIPADQIRNVTMPGVAGTAGAASVVRPSGAEGLFADFADDAVLQNH
ncbi:MAG: LCP family protein [Acidimicrobiia bacterium]